jgi:hypothetical protein
MTTCVERDVAWHPGNGTRLSHATLCIYERVWPSRPPLTGCQNDRQAKPGQVCEIDLKLRIERTINILKWRPAFHAGLVVADLYSVGSINRTVVCPRDVAGKYALGAL